MMQDLTEKIRTWAIDRGLDTADPSKQTLKLIEEVGEIAAGLARGNDADVKDGIGDAKVVATILKDQLRNEVARELTEQHTVLLLLLHDVGVLAREIAFKQDPVLIQSIVEQVERGLIALAETSNTTIEECTSVAWNEIKDRKGKMVDGVFVKESDLP